MRKNGGTPSRRDKLVTPAAISPPGVAQCRFVGGQQSGLAGCKPPPLFTRGASSCSSQGRRHGEPRGASPRPSAATYLPSIPTSSARGTRLKASLFQGSWRRYSCNRSSGNHVGTQAPPDTGDVFSLCPRRAARRAGVEGNWRRTGKGTKGGSGGEACSCVHRRHTMSKNQEEASVRSRESVDSLQTMRDAKSTGSEAQPRRTACAWHEVGGRWTGSKNGSMQVS